MQKHRALVLLGLAFFIFRAPLCLRSSWCYICIKIFFAYILLPLSELSVVGLALDLVD